MKVIATKKGFDGKVLREPGDVFDMPDGAKGSWFELVRAQKEDTSKAKTGGKPADDLA